MLVIGVEESRPTGDRRLNVILRGRRVVRVAATVALSGAIVVSVAASAGAATTQISGVANVRDCISGVYNTCGPNTSKGPLSNGTTITMVCWAFGDLATGAYASDVWFTVRVTSGSHSGVTGWVHSSVVANQTTVGRCGGALPTLGTDNYDGRFPKTTCSTKAVIVNGKAYCKNADFRKSPSQPKVNSPRGYGWRNCTDFVAFRFSKVPSYLNTKPLFELGNANAWDDYFRQHRTQWAIDQRPHLGDIFQSDSPKGLGHVAIVRSVDSTHKMVTVEEYNAGEQTIKGAYYGDGLYRKDRPLSVAGAYFIRRIAP